jgi:shikimate kinase
MGAGKSSVAGKLAEITGGKRIEMDQMIEEQQGRKITEIFAEEGEPYFRDLETALVRSFDGKEGMIISCGGGVVMRPENVSIMKSNGVIVLLTASPETILSRVKNSNDRPILNGHKNVEYISELMEKRSASYNNAADVKISTDGKTVEQIAREITTFTTEE